MGLRIAPIGVAGIGQAHLFAIASLTDDYELAAVCDIDRAAAEKAASDYKAPAFTTPEDLFASGVAEAVVIAVPPHLHGPLMRQALDAGLHVYCEKPVTPAFGEALDLARLSDDAGLVVQVGCQHRFQRSYVQAREMIAAGGIGRVTRANLFATNWFRPQRYFDARPWRGSWGHVGGGALLHQSIHQLDAFVSLVGLPARVTARAWRSLHRIDVEDEVMAMLEFGEGARGVLVASTVDPVGDNRLEVHGDAGSLVAEGFGLRYARFSGPVGKLSNESPDEFPEVPVEWADVVVPEEGQGEWFKLILDCHRDFAAAVRDGRPPRNHLAEAARAVELANALYLSAVRDAPVQMPLDADDYAGVLSDLSAGRAEIPRLPEVAVR